MSFDATDHTLYDGGRAPNPRRVAIYLAEREIDVERIPVDMAAMEHRSEKIKALNPVQQLPLLKLPDGSVISETMAICRYFEALFPGDFLFGSGAKQLGYVEMWQRRVEFQFLYPVAQAFRHIHPAMKQWEVPQIAQWGEANKPKAQNFAAILDGQLSENEFICGDSFSVADITAIIALDFSKPARIVYDEKLVHLDRWANAMRQRPGYKP